MICEKLVNNEIDELCLIFEFSSHISTDHQALIFSLLYVICNGSLVPLTETFQIKTNSQITLIMYFISLIGSNQEIIPNVSCDLH